MSCSETSFNPLRLLEDEEEEEDGVLGLLLALLLLGFELSTFDVRRVDVEDNDDAIL